MPPWPEVPGRVSSTAPRERGLQPDRPWSLGPEILRGGHICATSIRSRREVRDRFSDVVDRVEREHGRAAVTRNGRAAAVALRPEDLAELEETLDLLGDPEALADIPEADPAYRRGDVGRGVEAVRALRPCVMLSGTN
jgi:antitoxin YefM